MELKRVLVVNAGSSSVKLSVLDDTDNVLAAENIPSPGGQLDRAALGRFVGDAPPVDAVGHRVVHGGTDFTRPVRVDDAVLTRLAALTDLAPLHQPKSLEGLRAVGEVLPGVPAVACFDTAFHATIAPAARTYALPALWRGRWDLRRFGFHGLSHAYASRRAAEMCRRTSGSFRVVTCHLGAGASLAAVRDGSSVDTTMGFTPLEGLVMATRSGSVDPGLLMWLISRGGLSPSEISTALEHQSGLFGLAGTADMREVLKASAGGGGDASLALAVYVHRLVAGVGAMVAALGGLDALVFTGGVGENSPVVRERAVSALAFLGLALDGGANAATFASDQDISAQGAMVRSIVVTAREDREIVRGVRLVLAGPSA